MYLAIIGFAMVAVIVALLLKGKMSPIVAVSYTHLCSPPSE